MPDTARLTAEDGHVLSAYRAGPAAAAAGLVVVQEIFGVNRHMRHVCDVFAAEGYAAVAPALFDRVERDVELGYDPGGVEQGRALRGKLDDAAVMKDVAAAAASLGGKPVGIVGYCFGGTVAWWGATRTRLFAAASCWYGGGIAGTRDGAAELPGADAFRRPRPRHTAYGRKGYRCGAAGGRDLRLSGGAARLRMRGTAELQPG